ncbi:MAG: response regulator transcription factor [Bacteroidetes bacterium]|nr:response regulator transcription factor [Bacteroidota bacterium]
MKNKLKAVIVDDEKHARENLSGLLSEYCPNIKVIGEAADPSTAEKLINELNPDLLFLDIRLSNTTGFELLGNLKSRDFGVIFVTAYDNYAIKAIKFSAVDYILKPINHKELVEAIRKFTQKVESERKSIQLELLIENLSKERAFNRLGVTTEDRIELLLVKKIIRLKGESNYTRIFMEGGKTVLVSKTLVEFEDLLRDLGFLRVHKTHVVNIDRVKSMEKNGDIKLLLDNGTIVPVSRRRKAGVVESLRVYFSHRSTRIQ